MVARAKKATAVRGGKTGMFGPAALSPSGREIWPDVAIPPGDHLQEILELYGMSQSELARQMGRPVQAVNEIIRGAKAITPETALQLERVLRISGAVWVRLEANYQYNKARLGSSEHGRAAQRPIGQPGGERAPRRPMRPGVIRITRKK